MAGEMYRLTYQDGDIPLTYDFTSGEVVIGRSPDCQIVLRDDQPFVGPEYGCREPQLSKFITIRRVQYLPDLA